MPLFGTLSMMPLPELLRWLGSTRKTGTLRVERDHVSKCVLLNDGRICGCTSNDPPEKLGHFLLSRGRVTEDQLQSALEHQETSRKYLGEAFVAMGVLTEEELASHLEAQAEETVFGLFDWNDAAFRFNEDLSEQPAAFRLDLDIEAVVARGLERAAEMRKIREVFPDASVVLRKSSLHLPAEALGNTMARTLYDAITGDRSLAELLLHVHGSEYLVTRFLFTLHAGGFVEVYSPTAEAAPVANAGVEAAVDAAVGADATAGWATVQPGQGRATAGTAPPPVKAGPPAPQPAADPPDSWEMDLPDLAIDPPADDDPAGSAELLDIPDLFVESSDVEAADASPAFEMQKRLAIARRQLNSGEFDGALEVLRDLLRRHPDDDSLRRLLAEAEAAFIDQAYRHYVPATKVPTLARSLESLANEQLTPSEAYLISRIDGTWTVKAIVQISPLREVDVLMTLKRLRESGVIEFKDAEAF